MKEDDITQQFLKSKTQSEMHGKKYLRFNFGNLLIVCLAEFLSLSIQTVDQKIKFKKLPLYFIVLLVGLIFMSKQILKLSIMLCFDFLTRPFRVTHRKEVTHSSGSYERKSRGRKLADEMGRGKEKSHYTLIDWRTGREWPLNCMTVISARWRSHRLFQRKRKWHIPIARHRKKLQRCGGVSMSPRGSLKVI